MSHHRETRAVFFWFGGVITRSVPELIAQEVLELPFEQIETRTRLFLRESVQDLYVGKIGGYPYCQKVLEGCQSKMEADELQHRLCSSVRAAPAVLETINILPPKYERWLVVDFPRDWFDKIHQRLDVETCISLDRAIFTSECGLTHLTPEIFYQLASRSGYLAQEIILVDGDTPRAVQAVREKFSSTIFVDARRLKRDFVLRKLI